MERSIIKRQAEVRSEELRTNPPQVMNAREVAIFPGISERKVRSETAIGQIRHVRFGRRILYRIEDIKGLLEVHLKGGQL